MGFTPYLAFNLANNSQLQRYNRGILFHIGMCVVISLSIQPILSIGIKGKP